MAINKATIIENIYKEFYDLFSAITDFDIYPAFPRKEITAKSSYPIMILDSPEISWDKFTFTKNSVSGTISLNIYTTKAETCDKYASDAIDKIETSRRALADAGLRKINLDSTVKDIIMHSKISVHVKSITFSYIFYFTKTTAY